MNKLLIIALSLATSLVLPAGAQDLPKNAPTKERLRQRQQAVHLTRNQGAEVGRARGADHDGRSLCFVGTKGLGVFLFTTSAGHILMNTGMPSSGPMIVDSIRKLGFKPEDIKIMSPTAMLISITRVPLRTSRSSSARGWRS